MDNFQLEQLNQLKNRIGQYYWSLETLNYFKDIKEESKLKDEIAKFVWENCSLEDNETFEDLAQDLLRQVKELK